MGKTLRNSTTSRSEWFRSNKTRGLIRKLDRNSHHSLRNDNRNSDELTFNRFKKKHHQVIQTDYNKSNVPNFSKCCGLYNHSNFIDDLIINEKSEYCSKRNGSSLKDNLQIFIDNNKEFIMKNNKKCNQNFMSQNKFVYLLNSLKQLQRRGKLNEFDGRKNERNDKFNFQNNLDK